MSIMIREVSHDLECHYFRDLFNIQACLKVNKKLRIATGLAPLEAATLHLVSDAACSLAVVARDIWTRRLGCVVEPISPVVD